MKVGDEQSVDDVVGAENEVEVNGKESSFKAAAEIFELKKAGGVLWMEVRSA